uniref:Putative ovule protein n=1 Tax=Solanum chacoense TaxID=4108 RepID=A0A0V0HJ72_SOLCH
MYLSSVYMKITCASFGHIFEVGKSEKELNQKLAKSFIRLEIVYGYWYFFETNKVCGSRRSVSRSRFEKLHHNST